MTAFWREVCLRFISKCLLVAGALSAAVLVHSVHAEESGGIGIVEHLGQPVSIHELEFRDETGRNVHLSDYFRPGRPVLLTLVYFECPDLCTTLLNGMATAARNTELKPGSDFEIVTISISPNESAKLAAEKKASYIGLLPKGDGSAWHFLTGGEEQIRTLTREVGFKYRYDSRTKDYDHPAALLVLTPEGRVARYLYGVEFEPHELRMALWEGSGGKIGSWRDRALGLLFRYDPRLQHYRLRGEERLYWLAGLAALLLGMGAAAVVFRILSRTKKKS